MKALALQKVFMELLGKNIFFRQLFSPPLQRGGFWLQLCCAVAFLFVILSSFAYGTTTNTWTQSTESDFSKGTSQNVSINNKGEIRLSPEIEAITGIRSAFVWSLAEDLQNRIYVGTGDPGTVYLIKDGSEAVEFFKSPELYIQSLAVDKHGNLYAGTAPRGIIYKINNKGETTIFCSLPASYIWDMSVDNNSNLVAATGNDGILFKISPDGTPAVLFDSPETNLMDIHLDRYDNIYIGTEPNGLVYKIAPSGQAQVLYDASEGEIHCLAMDSMDNIYAGTALGAPVQVPVAPPPQPPLQTGIITSVFKEEKSWELNLPEELPMAQTSSLQQQRAAVKGAEVSPRTTGLPTAPNYVYKITQEGLAQKLLEISQAFIFGMSFDSQNNLYVVTGNMPGVYKVSVDETSSNLAKVEEMQALCCLNTNTNELYFGTGNLGRVYKILPSFKKEGAFISNVLDTTAPSNWGSISWTDMQPEDTGITLATRSGNCEKPDSTWSGWSAPYTESGGRIASPPARFIQYKATLQTMNSNSTPVLNMVSLSYLPKNQPPRIISFTVEKESFPASQKPPETKTDSKAESKPQAAVSQKPHHQIAQKNIQWEVEDQNNDTLQVTICYKGIEERAWKVIDKNTQKKGSYAWDTLRLPDGKYQVRLTASDDPDNPPETAFSVENTIQPIMVDNSRPDIKSLNTAAGTRGRYVISGTVEDKYSNIVKVQYTIDGQEWISAYPVDGIFDSLEESFQITTKPLTAGDYTLIINAFDSDENIGVEKVMIEVK
ncbi:MAG: hypothetical protein L6Q53_01015 [Candidatus Brocadia sinica]|nr:hypothetical protein [Candidatus Brocadia sinica]NUO04467.1 hypothetical protein [Candidatus Brocadia sinica]